MADQNAKSYFFWIKFGIGEFLESLIMNKNSEIQNRGSNMVDRNAKSCVFWMKVGTRGFLRSLIMNLETKFRN